MNYLDFFTELPNLDEEVQQEEVEEVNEDDQLLSLTVEELDLSLRSFNCLKRAGLNTVGEILEMTRDELSKIKNFGKKSFDEVEQKIQDLGLELKSSEDDE